MLHVGSVGAEAMEAYDARHVGPLAASHGAGAALLVVMFAGSIIEAV